MLKDYNYMFIPFGPFKVEKMSIDNNKQENVRYSQVLDVVFSPAVFQKKIRLKTQVSGASYHGCVFSIPTFHQASFRPSFVEIVTQLRKWHHGSMR